MAGADMGPESEVGTVPGWLMLRLIPSAAELRADHRDIVSILPNRRAPMPTSGKRLGTDQGS